MTRTTAVGRTASRIALGEEYEVQYWTKKFGVSCDELENAIDAVGNSADAVKKHLAGDVSSNG